MTNKGKMNAIDANVILRYLLGDDKILSAKAINIMNAIEIGDVIVSCDPVNLAEVVWVLKSFYKLPNSEISEGLGPILKTDGFVIPNKDRYILALELFADSMDHFGDACACATALEDCDGRLYSFDRKLSEIKGIARKESIK
jgi:predicted nucleic-acid-binding protein